MKHNVTVALNQRVDRVTERTLVIGVDIAKERHVAQAANFRGRILNRYPIRFNNSEEGFQQLLCFIHKLQKQFGMNDVIVGMESTGHYFFNLANWLVNSKTQVVLVNPATTKRNKENRDNTPSKSDPKDAAVIADMVGRGYYISYEPRGQLFQRLNVLVRARDRIDRDLTRIKNRIHGWLDKYFPEYISVFKNPFTTRSIATLNQFPTPEDLNELSLNDVLDGWTKQGMQRPGGSKGMAKAFGILKVARHSIGSTMALEEAKWELEQLLKDYDRVQEAHKEAEDKIRSLLPEVPTASLLQTIGLTPNLCSSILAFGGDLSQLDHGNQLLRMAGLNLAERSSGKYKGKIKLSKRGSSKLRKQLFLAVLHLVKNNPTFREWHQFNVQTKGMKKMQSIMKLMGKLTRILVAMARKKEIFQVKVVAHQAA